MIAINSPCRERWLFLARRLRISTFSSGTFLIEMFTPITASIRIHIGAEMEPKCNHGAAKLLILQHRRDDAVGRFVAVGEGFDVDDDLLAHVHAAFDRG